MLTAVGRVPGSALPPVAAGRSPPRGAALGSVPPYGGTMAMPGAATRRGTAKRSQRVPADRSRPGRKTARIPAGTAGLRSSRNAQKGPLAEQHRCGAVRLSQMAQGRDRRGGGASAFCSRLSIRRGEKEKEMEQEQPRALHALRAPQPYGESWGHREVLGELSAGRRKAGGCHVPAWKTARGGGRGRAGAAAGTGGSSPCVYTAPLRAGSRLPETNAVTRSRAERCARPHLRAVGSALCPWQRELPALLSGGLSCQQPAAGDECSLSLIE